MCLPFASLLVLEQEENHCQEYSLPDVHNTSAEQRISLRALFSLSRGFLRVPGLNYLHDESLFEEEKHVKERRGML
jgi:hypothetical protein